MITTKPDEIEMTRLEALQWCAQKPEESVCNCFFGARPDKFRISKEGYFQCWSYSGQCFTNIHWDTVDCFSRPCKIVFTDEDK